MTTPLARFTSFPSTMYRVFRHKEQLRPFAAAIENYTLKKRGQGIDSPFEDIPEFPVLPQLGELSPKDWEAIKKGTKLPDQHDHSAANIYSIVSKYMNMFSFDCVVVNGNVLPMTGNFYVVPNGLSLTPESGALEALKRSWKGERKFVEVPKGTMLTDGLILVHERGDHYSMQVSQPMSLQEANHRMTVFFKNLKTVPF